MAREILGVTTWKERWEHGIMGDVRRGFSFVFYLMTAWRTAAAVELGFKTLSAHLHTFTMDALIIHRPLAVHLGTLCSLSLPRVIN